MAAGCLGFSGCALPACHAGKQFDSASQRKLPAKQHGKERLASGQETQRGERELGQGRMGAAFQSPKMQL